MPNENRSHMSTITRRLPQTKRTREIALTAAKEKKDSAPPSGNILTARTTARLDALEPDYAARMRIVAEKKYAFKAKTIAKNAAFKMLKTFTSAFLRSFNIGVELGEFDAQARALYQWPGTGSFPKLIAEHDFINVGKNIIQGEAMRVAGGGAPMSRPAIADFTTIYHAFKNLRLEQNNLKAALAKAQKDVDALNTEADAVIKKTWDEVETFYNEADKPSQRAHAGLWGVVYIALGKKAAAANGKMTDASASRPASPAHKPTLEPAAAAIETQMDAEGNCLVSATRTAPLVITRSAIGYADNPQKLNRKAGAPPTMDFPITAPT